MHVNLINNSSWDSSLLKEIVNFSIRGIKKYLPVFSIEYSDYSFDENWKTLERTYYDEITWDGWSSEDKRVLVVLHPKVEFPMAWWINPKLKDKYFRGMIFNDYKEYLVYITAHEIFHQVQFKNPKFKLAHSLLKMDDESEADLYAINKLTEWRNK